jgi:hypothetical protein
MLPYACNSVATLPKPAAALRPMPKLLCSLPQFGLRFPTQCRSTTTRRLLRLLTELPDHLETFSLPFSRRASVRRPHGDQYGACMSDSLVLLRDGLRTFVDARNWPRYHRPRNLALALAGDVGELVAELQWVADCEVADGLADPDAKARLSDEAAANWSGSARRVCPHHADQLRPVRTHDPR